MIDASTYSGAKQLDLEQRQYPLIDEYVKSYGNPDFIFKDGQMSVYFIYRDAPKVVHFSISVLGGGTIDIKNTIPSDFQHQIDSISPRKNYETINNTASQNIKEAKEELFYDDDTGKGTISIEGNLSARPYLVKKIGDICSSKHVLLKSNIPPNPGYYKILNEELKDGKLTIEFQATQ